MTKEELLYYVEKMFEERDKAFRIELNAAKEAVKIAEENAQKWREQANEWRSTMNDKDKLLMQRAEFLTYVQNNGKIIEDLKTRVDKNEGKGAGIQQFIGWILAGIAIIGFIIAWTK